MAVTLKFLNGPMQGRALTLPPGKVTLGLGDVDLQMVFENGISLATLQVQHDAVELLEPHPCWVEGYALRGQRLPAGKIIDLAGQAFVLLNEGETFTFRRIPERLAPGRWRLSRPHRRIAAGALLLLLLCGALAGGYLWLHQETLDEKVDRLGVQRWLAQLHRTPALRTLGFDWLSDDTLRIYGQCLQQRDLNALLKVLRARGVFWHLETQCQDSLRDLVADLLEQNGYRDIRVSDGRMPGNIVIDGDIQADRRWEQVVSQLSALDGLKGWRVSRRGAQDGQTLLNIARRAGVLGKVSLERRAQRLIVSGILSAPQRAKLRQELAEWQKKQNISLVFQDISAAAADDALFPKPIISIGGNQREPYVALSDGRRLQVGARLASGYEIAHISVQTGIDLVREGSLLHLPVNL